MGQSTGLIAAGCIIAPIIPPSISFIIFGVAANISVTKLFMAGIVPGLLMGLTLTAVWAYSARRSTGIKMAPKESGAVRLKAFRDSLWDLRWDERRVGKGCVSPCRFWWSPYL